MIEANLEQAAQTYPKDLIEAQLQDIPRIAFTIRLALNGSTPINLSICDLGGGFSLFAVGCASIGMKAMVIDDFSDDWHTRKCVAQNSTPNTAFRH